MAIQILAGLARVGATAGRAAATGARAAARGTKKLAVRKAKSFAKDKVKSGAKKEKSKLSKKSNLLSSEGDQQQQKLQSSMVGGEPSATLTGTKDPVIINPAPSSKSQVEQLKINVTNIRSFLVKSNKQYTKQQANTRRNESVQRSKAKLRGEERRLGKRSSPLAKSASIVKGAMKPAGSLFDRIMEFASIILLGILVNALPTIVEKVKEVIDNLVNFFTPIQSGFRVIMSLFSDDINQDQLDVDKKRFDDGIQNIQGKGGLLDKIKEKLGPFGGAIDLLKGAIDKFRDILGIKKASTKMKLEKRDGKEGFVNTETGKFTERQFTSAERESYGGRSTGSTGSTGSTEANQNITTLGSENTQLKNFTDQDFSDLAFIVSHEALRGTDDEYGVAAAVLNRVTDPRFPNTIMDVGTEPGQFEAVFSGKAYRDENLAKKLKNNQGKIVEALRRLNGRTDFKAFSSMGKYKGDTDIMFTSNGNFYHYAEQVGKYDPIPSNIPQHWKKLIGNYIQANTGTGRDGKFGAGTFGKERPSDSSRELALNKPDPRENSTTIIALQRVNTIQPIPQPYPVFLSGSVSTYGGDQSNNIWYRELTQKRP